jgi:hypothetical protein
MEDDGGAGEEGEVGGVLSLIHTNLFLFARIGVDLYHGVALAEMNGELFPSGVVLISGDL